MVKRRAEEPVEAGQSFRYERAALRGQYALKVPGMELVPRESRYKPPKASSCGSANFDARSTNCPVQLVYPDPDGEPHLRLCTQRGRYGALVAVRSIDDAYEKAIRLCTAAGYLHGPGRKSLIDAAKQESVALLREKGRRTGPLVLGSVRRRGR